MHNALNRAQQSGFTLIELIIVIVITAIIAVGSTHFIVNAAKGMHDVSTRAAIANAVATSSEKIERQLYTSAVSSIRVIRNEHNQCVEMLPITTSAFYLAGNGTNQLEVIGLQKNVVGMRAISGSDSHLSTRDIGSVVNGQSPVLNEQTSQLAMNNPFRFVESKQQLVHFVTHPISYCLEGDKLYRYSQYRWREQQRLPDKLPQKEPFKVLLGKDFLADSNFSFDREKQYFELVLSAGNKSEKLTINLPMSLGRDE